MQPLMNMITFTARSRERIVTLHTAIADAVTAQDAASADQNLHDLAEYTQELAQNVIAARSADNGKRAKASGRN